MLIEDEHQITDLETIKVISDPLRVEILEQIGIASDAGKLTTVKQLAEALDRPATKLYYHVNLLEKHDLIRVAETRIVSGIVEKQYQIRAKRLTANLDISKNSVIDRDEGMQLALSSISNMFDKTYRNIEKSFRHRMQDGDADQVAPEPVEMLSSQVMMRLSLEQAEEFRSKMDALIREYADLNHPGGLSFGLTVVFNPNFHINPSKLDAAQLTDAQLPSLGQLHAPHSNIDPPIEPQW